MNEGLPGAPGTEGGEDLQARKPDRRRSSRLTYGRPQRHHSHYLAQSDLHDAGSAALAPSQAEAARHDDMVVGSPTSYTQNYLTYCSEGRVRAGSASGHRFYNVHRVGR